MNPAGGQTPPPLEPLVPAAPPGAPAFAGVLPANPNGDRAPLAPPAPVTEPPVPAAAWPAAPVDMGGDSGGDLTPAHPSASVRRPGNVQRNDNGIPSSSPLVARVEENGPIGAGLAASLAEMSVPPARSRSWQASVGCSSRAADSLVQGIDRTDRSSPNGPAPGARLGKSIGVFEWGVDKRMRNFRDGCSRPEAPRQ